MRFYDRVNELAILLDNERFEEVTPADIHLMLRKEYPHLTPTACSPYKIGHVMKSMGFSKRKTNKGVVYKVA